MSYKSKKLKKSKLNQLKNAARLVKIALFKNKTFFSITLMKKKTFTQKEAQMFQLDKVVQVFRSYDRLPRNPDIPGIASAISRQLETEGLIRLNVFVCPQFNKDELFSATPERYMPITASSTDLFQARIPKILSLKAALGKVGLFSQVSLVIGDNDAEQYIFPFMKLRLNTNLYRQRQSLYRAAFETMARDLFGDGDNCIVWSLAENGICLDESTKPTIPEGALAKEMAFLSWLFSDNGPYRGLLKFPKETLKEMIRLKYKLYGAQGKFLETLGGILLQTEGPGVWVERTNMLRCTGAAAVPAIYPWIRKEDGAE